MRLKIEQLTKTYGERTVLNINELEINSGGFYGIVGANGAGKSTLLNLIAGLDTPTSGRILYGDDALTKTPYREMTLVFQKAYLTATTTEKNIGYPLKLRRWSKKDMDRRAEELMEELGILHLRKQKAWRLSGGETQKVSLARALSFRPRLLLLDEPTANVDPSATAEIEAMLKKINGRDGITIILITHNLAQGKRICSDGIFLHKGELIEADKGPILFSQPKEELTKKFLAGELLY